MENIPEPLKKIGRILWYGRSRFSFLDFPILCRLPYGSWFLARGDEMGLVAFFHLSYEKNEWQFVEKFLKPRMVFFDVGANQGFYTLLAAKKIGPEGKVFAFEPVPREFKNLKCNVFINRFKNIKMEPIALGHREESTNMYVCLDGKGSYSSLRPPSKKVRARRKVIKVPLTNLDNYVQNNNINSIDFMKIDVEGGELDILKGGENVLSKLRPVLMCEFSDDTTKQWSYSASEIYNFLKKYKYQWFEVVPKGLLHSLNNKTSFNENLIAVPEEKVKSFSII